MPPPLTLDAKKALALRATEPAIIAALKARGRQPRARDLIPIPDEDGEPFVAFWVHALAEPEYQRLQTLYSPARRDPDSGIEIAGTLDVSAYRTAVILEATEAEDRRALWQSAELREAYGVGSENQLVDKLLGGPGMKLAVIQRIDALARYGVVLPKVERLEEVLKDSSRREES